MNNPASVLQKVFQNPTTPQPQRPVQSQSNQIIISRNRGVQHQFVDSIGGCSANYR